MSNPTLKERQQEAFDQAVAAFADGGTPSQALTAWARYRFQAASAAEDMDAMVDTAFWCTDLERTLKLGTRCALRTWFAPRQGDQVSTLQVHSDGRMWAPADRTVDEVAATYVSLGGSRRRYREVSVVAATPECIVLASDHLVCAYRMSYTAPSQIKG